MEYDPGHTIDSRTHGGVLADQSSRPDTLPDFQTKLLPRETVLYVQCRSRTTKFKLQKRPKDSSVHRNLLEAPVIATDCPGAIREIRQRNKTIVMVPPEVPQELAKGIIKVCSQSKPTMQTCLGDFDVKTVIREESALLWDKDVIRSAVPAKTP